MREIGRLFRKIHIADATVGGGEVLCLNAEIVHRGIQTALDRTERGAFATEAGEGIVDDVEFLGDVLAGYRITAIDLHGSNFCTLAEAELFGVERLQTFEPNGNRVHVGFGFALIHTDLNHEAILLIRIEKLEGVEFRSRGDAIDFIGELRLFAAQTTPLRIADGISRRLHGEFAQADHDVANLIERAFRNLHHRHGVRCVAFGLIEATDLGPQAF